LTQQLAEILLSIDDSRSYKNSIHKSIYSESLAGKMTDAVIRSLEALSSPGDRRFLGPKNAEEIIYRVLCG
jgi:hypothetical protein